ncbi:MAG TPA: cation-transporting P-type ATPase [Gemmatimonadaceae bacterium]|nr:cation-transporting P-type ATPase [Gemmatimonadaceae bacterium]
MTHNYHALSAADALRGLQTAPGGLTDAEARARLTRFGPNQLRVARPRPAWKILLDQLRSVVVLLLIVAVGVSLVSRDMLDAAAIGAVLVLNTLLGFFTELRARRAMYALLRLEAPRAVVVRANVVREIDARDLVPGDVIRLEAGQAVPADARLLEASDLRVDEAALTGESLPVQKIAQPVADDTPLPERSDMVYKGTNVIAGATLAVVVGTGMETELGRIGGLVAEIKEERTPLEHRLDVLGRRLVWLALAVGALVVGLGALQHLPLERLIQTGIALAIAAVPEGLPVVSTIALAVGVHRMARRNALVRRLPSVETLGSVTIICTDKTGTLTAGEMTATTLWVAGREIHATGTGYAPDGTFTEDGQEIAPLDDPAIALALRIAVLANRADISRGVEGTWTVRGDPTEGALLALGLKAGIDRARLRVEWLEVGEVPFSSERMLMATFHQPTAHEVVAYVKGAPRRVLESCTRVLSVDGERPLDDVGRGELLERNRQLASRGLRVLALACAEVSRADATTLRNLMFVGYVGMLDPAAPGVRETVLAFRDAGIRTVMLTGDQQLTAQAIARDLGILRPNEDVLDARELARLSETDLGQRVERIGAFSRVSPEQKLTIVSGYQHHGEIVAMLGDGVNDAAALKKADVGVAMGRRGTDVAKDAAEVVLQDDRFQTISAAVEEGRVIFDNIRKFVFYLFSCNLAEVLVLLGAGAAGSPLPLIPLQILWLNLVTDTFPAFALALEPAEPDVMRRPPRDPREAIMSGSFLGSVVFYAMLIAAVTLAAFAWASAGPGADGGNRRAATLSFMTLALAQTFHLGNARQRGPVVSARHATANWLAVGAVMLVVLLQVATVYVPVLVRVLDTYPLAPRDWAAAVALGLVPAVVGQALKLFRERRSILARSTTS